MATGTQHAAACYPTQLEAANAWCSAYGGLSGAGVSYSCAGVVSGAAADAGGASTFVWKRKEVSAGGTTSNNNITGQFLPACETYGFDYFAPIVAAFAAALVLVVAGRLMFRAINTRGE
jgi:hypothetical protein